MHCKSCGNPSSQLTYLVTEAPCSTCLKMWLRATLRSMGKAAHKLVTRPA